MITREQHGELRAGRITGQTAQRIMVAKNRATWNTIAAELRDPKPFYDVDASTPEPLAWGHRHEPMAAGAFFFNHPEYEVRNPRFMHWHDVTQAQMFRHFGVSPDRMLTLADRLDWVAGLEIKSPYDSDVHAATVRLGRVPDTAIWQCYHGMFVTGLTDWWFVSFDPRCSTEARYFEYRIPFEQWRMDQLRRTLMEFLDGYLSGEHFAPRSYDAAAFDRMF